jgi:hypothetical protein
MATEYPVANLSHRIAEDRSAGIYPRVFRIGVSQLKARFMDWVARILWHKEPNTPREPSRS